MGFGLSTTWKSGFKLFEGINRVNILGLGDEELIPVDYGDLLDKILEVLQENNPFSLSGDKQWNLHFFKGESGNR